MKFGCLVCAWWLGFSILCGSAAAEAPRLVFVSSQGPLTTTEIGPLLDTLTEEGFAVSPTTVRAAVGSRFPMAARQPTMSAASFAKVLEQANLVWVQQPPLARMLPVLDAALQTAAENPVLLIHDPSLKERLLQLVVASSIAYQRASDVKRSEDAMAEFIRASPTGTVSRAKDGPAAEQIYQLTRNNLSKLGRGTLTVKTSDPDLQIYVNERIARPNTPIADHVPGLYRVVAIDSLDRARRYLVPIMGGQQTTLDINWAIDSALHEAPGWVELRFQTETERAKRADLARAFTRSTSAKVFVLVDFEAVAKGRRLVVASLRDALTGRTLREAAVEIPASDDGALHALGQFIGGSAPTGDVIVRVLLETVEHEAPAAKPVAPRVERTEAPRVRKYIATAVGATLLAGGAVLWAVGDVQNCSASERDPRGQCPRVVTLRNPGYVALGLGAAVGAVAGYFWYKDRPSRARITMQVDPSGSAAFVGASWAFW